MSYPRAVTTIHQIEVTTRCNLRCKYCPSPNLPKIRGQAPMDMSIATFERALEWCKHFDNAGTMPELSLTGIGETLLHPEWPKLMRLARNALPDMFINFSTNGLLLDRDACYVLKALNIRVFVSLHRPEKAGPAIQLAHEFDIFEDYNEQAATSAMDWAGQVDWYVSACAEPCVWLRDGRANVLVDGRITTCCMDAAGVGVVAHVDDPVGVAEIKPYSLCDGCHMTVPA